MSAQSKLAVAVFMALVHVTPIEIDPHIVAECS